MTMSPETVRELILMGLADTHRADELLHGVMRRRTRADLLCVDAPELLADDPFFTAIRLAQKAIGVVLIEQRKVLDSQVGYLRDTPAITDEYRRNQADCGCPPVRDDDLDDDLVG